MKMTDNKSSLSPAADTSRDLSKYQGTLAKKGVGAGTVMVNMGKDATGVLKHIIQWTSPAALYAWAYYNHPMIEALTGVPERAMTLIGCVGVLVSCTLYFLAINSFVCTGNERLLNKKYSPLSVFLYAISFPIWGVGLWYKETKRVLEAKQDRHG